TPLRHVLCYPYCAAQHFHSFPTRRSSDLFAENGFVYLTYHKPTSDGGGATTLARGRWDGTALVDVQDIFESGATDTEASRLVFRSEEHTSELQSRENLVCRLLLEKKNENI